MYSLVLMAALTGGDMTANWGCRHCRCSCHCCGCWGCHGCCGCWGCHGCCGGWGCHGCWGCYGGYAGYCWGCFGCYGGYTCYGCYGCNGYYGAPVYMAPGQVVPKEEQAPAPKKEKGDEVRLQNRARLIVQVPADAKLFIDDQPMKSTAAQRSFITPVLQSGRTYYYEVRAELVRDGRTVTENQRVILRPGDVVQASFANLGQNSNATAQAQED